MRYRKVLNVSENSSQSFRGEKWGQKPHKFDFCQICHSQTYSYPYHKIYALLFFELCKKLDLVSTNISLLLVFQAKLIMFPEISPKISQFLGQN